ncbi:hypothetical protein KIW84_052136 [Lathyrus oleraceus]|uniref:Uncharacterized protein n=1 Tax=Pisum sativum TaxID=3888 RepID=A0A9D4WLV9_PEA|nr:hypothetical protein KIW84_052136 [Pisum sativum]
MMMQNVLNMAFATGLLYDVVLLQISTIVVWFCKVVCMMNMIVVVCCRLYHNSWLAQGKAMICTGPFSTVVPNTGCTNPDSKKMAAIPHHSEAVLAKRLWIKFNRESISSHQL